LGSKFGTRVDGEEIRGNEKVPLRAESKVQIGETALKVEMPVENSTGFAELPPQPTVASTIEIEKVINSSPKQVVLPKSCSLEADQRQALLLEILIQFSLPAPLDQLLRTIIGRVVELIPGAERGALLLRNPATDGLLLAAFVSVGEPAVSETLARQALKQHQAFIWRNKFGCDPTRSILRHQIQSGMYAPLIYDDRPLGVLCVDNPDCHSDFSDDDLQLLVAVADHAAVAVSHHQLQEELRDKSKLLELLLAQFPPDVREQLIENARSTNPSVNRNFSGGQGTFTPTL
jgi:transcriptional regulator with GAF, ATPase, and Fis domain